MKAVYACVVLSMSLVAMGEEKPAPATPLAPELMETEGVHLDALVVAKGVARRTPVDAGTTFPLGTFERIYAFLKVENPSETEDEVTVSWAPADGGRERGTVAVSIGAQKRWRTWAFTRTIKKAGRWEVLVRDNAGNVIGRAPFEITSEE